MSKQEEQQTTQDKTTTDTAPAASAKESHVPTVGPGKQLAIAREAMGLSQQDVADRLHLRITSVQSVEDDALEPGVSVTFTKGYVRLYAKLVNLPAEPLLQAYDQLHAKENKPAKLQSFSRRVTREAHDHRWNMVSIVVVLLVLGSVVVWWVEREGYLKDSGKNISEVFDGFLSSDNENGGEGSETQSVDEEADADPQDSFSTLNNDNIQRQNTGPAIPEEDVVQLNNQDAATDADASSITDPVSNLIEDGEELLNETTDDVEDGINDVTDTVNAATTDAVDDITDAVDDVTETADNTATNGRIADPSRGDIVEGVFNEDGYRVNADGTVDVTFTFKDDCWVSVKDKDGEIMAIGVKTKGRVMQVNGLPPVNIILGAPQAVEIDFGGYRVDMDVYPGGESARFSLPIESE